MARHATVLPGTVPVDICAEQAQRNETYTALQTRLNNQARYMLSGHARAAFPGRLCTASQALQALIGHSQITARGGAGVPAALPTGGLWLSCTSAQSTNPYKAPKKNGAFQLTSAWNGSKHSLFALYYSSDPVCFSVRLNINASLSLMA